MTSPDEIQLVFCTVPDADTGRRIASALVEYQLAACVNLLPAIESIYRWEGEVTSSAEVLLMIKARAADYPLLETRIRALHPYELPEIIAVPLTAGLPAYLDWVRNPDEAK
ncbi:periplasmic divalent cation tolerance protein [Thiogranum longum]|uniref:Periplasmic divalent cation tolerance protein n=2 Tax=Thiogranum longum TaxID=1537524 RepID=A0A4R1HGN9_9GAMM|nr:divalent-cation tolerance protein CutA [Thiogranum longum]TCK19450.1 periplasmic divalent cation tolerance protein [Thiogranum longum]